jgi:hypothetical protein
VPALERTEEITLTVTGRSSGREIFHPVWFVQERRTLYLLPVSGSDSAWFKNVVKTPTIRLAAGRATWTARAKPVRDRARLRDVVEKFSRQVWRRRGEEVLFEVRRRRRGRARRLRRRPREKHNRWSIARRTA